jgi:thioredoxin:protein disulfide reductase
MDSRPISTGFVLKLRAASAIASAVVAFLFTTTAVSAADTGLPGAEPKLLPAQQAFRFSARALTPQWIEARFDVADGYYLYRDKLRFSSDPGGPVLGAADLPPGQPKHDEFFGQVETYRGALVVKVPVGNGVSGQAIVVKADSQGCADIGICYPPTVQQVRLSLPAPGAGPGPLVDAAPPRKDLFN